VEDLVELSYLLECKIEAVLENSSGEGYREALVAHLSDAYANLACGKYNKDVLHQEVWSDDEKDGENESQ
jgi:hypothetical protein